MQSFVGEGELAESSINHPRKRDRSYLHRIDCPPRFFRPKGQVELQPIRQVGTHKACTRTGENGSKRERERIKYRGDRNPHDKLHRPVMLIAHLKARLQNKLLDGEPEETYKTPFPYLY